MTFEEAFAFLQTVTPLRITVSGDIGAGKSTFAKRLAEELGIPRIYVGQLMREEAARRGLTLDAFNALLEKDDSIDRQMDALQGQKAEEIERGVFEGRTSWFFVKNADVRTFFKVDAHQAAGRIWGDSNDLRDTYPSKESLAEANIARKQSEMERFTKYYGINAYDLANFDLIIDTTELDIQGVFETSVIQIAEFLKSHQR